MTDTLSISDLYTPVTADECYEQFLEFCDDLDLDTTAWQEGGPERTVLAVVSHVLAARDSNALPMGRGGLLRHARGSWLTMLARDVYGVTRPEASYASAEDALTLTNAGGAVYTLAAGDLTVSSSTTGKTYRNSNGGVLAGLGTLTLDLIAEEAGTDSNAGIGEIDTIVAPAMIAVTCTNPVALVGTDPLGDDGLVALCLLAPAAVSPNGAAQAYEYKARTTLRADGSTVDINRCRVTGDSNTGAVAVVVAGPSGPPAAGDVTLVDDAIQTTVTPLTVTPTVAAATGVTVPIVATLYVPDTCLATDDELEDAVNDGLAGWFSTYPIGGRTKTPGGAGYLFADALRARICAAATYASIQAAAAADPEATVAEVLTRSANYDAFSATLTTPAADTALTSTQVAVLGAVTLTISRVAQ